MSLTLIQLFSSKLDLYLLIKKKRERERGIEKIREEEFHTSKRFT